MTKKKLLFLSNGRKLTSLARLDLRFEALGLEVVKMSAFDGDFPENLDEFDGIFLSGSPHGAYEDIPFINREHELIREAADKNIPMLGICFGSQILASALCGRDQVFRRDFCEIGYKDLPTSPATKTDLIAHELPETVNMFVWHNDEVKAAHPDMVILAWSDICPNHVWRYKDKPIWGIQGHPEFTAAQAVLWFEENRERMTLDGADIEALKASAQEAEIARTMISNFAALVKAA